MTDALSVAERALVEATKALTEIGYHERECARRYEEVAANTQKVMEVVEDVQEKLAALLVARGVSDYRSGIAKALFGGIPNVIWGIIGTGLWAILTVIALRLWPVTIR